MAVDHRVEREDASQTLPKVLNAMRVEDSVRQLQGLVDRIVAESGNPSGFDSARWVSEWIEKPNAALGGRLPREFFEEAGGLERVRSLLVRMQSGAFS